MTVDNAVTRIVHTVPPEIVDAVVGPGPVRREFAAALHDHRRRHVDRPPGYFILSGMDHLAEDAARRFLLASSAVLGDPLPHDFDGEVVREVRYRGVRLEDGVTPRYSDTKQGGNLHTDGMHRPGPVPTMFALYCVRQSPVGGTMILVHADDIVRTLRDEVGGDEEVLRILRQPFHFDTRDDTPGRPATVPRPILEFDGDQPLLCYLRGYLDSGHRRPGVDPLTPAQVRALDTLDAVLDREDLHTRVRLAPGQLVVVNNRTVVHGRTPFEDDPDPTRGRLLLRTWIADHGPPSSSDGGDSRSDVERPGPVTS
jgi:alpha-ketoglutarate-dependent taurine dioxygenase